MSVIKKLREGESVLSHTVSLEELSCTLIIDAHEGWNVATFDVPGAYLHMEIPKDNMILMNLIGDFVDIMCQVIPEYKQHVRNDNEKNVLYFLLLRAIYGCIESTLMC